MADLDTLCVEITSRCPLRCLHCSVAAGPERREFLSVSALKDFLSELPRLTEIYLSGGEPFEHPDLLKFVSLGKAEAATVVIYSSGTRRDGGVTLPISTDDLAATACAGVDRIDVSLYGASARDHDEVTQTSGSFVATLTTLRRLRLLGIPFGIHYVPVADGGSNFLPVLNMARTLGASRFHVLAVASQGRGRTLRASPQPRFYEEVRQLWNDDSNLTFVVSSKTRREAGILDLSHRDSFRVAMLDSSGFLYPNEASRQIEFRSRRALGSASVAELLHELA